MGTSLWLVPSKDDSEKLKAIMESYHPTSNISSSSFPKFQPHVTLTTVPSSPEAQSALRSAVPRSQPSVPVHFKSVQVGYRYFTSVFISVHNIPALDELHSNIHRALQMEPKTPMFPHLSLCYVDDVDAEERTNYYEHLRNSGILDENETEGGARLKYGDADSDWIDCYEGCEIWVAQCEGPVEDWKILERIRLLPEHA